MEAYNGVFIASTNRMECIDSAALRRFDIRVKFDALKPQQAWKVLQSYYQAWAIKPTALSCQRTLTISVFHGLK
jgi:AAA+ superfamily predicted ATPase